AKSVVTLPKKRTQKPKRHLKKRYLKSSKAQAEYVVVEEEKEDEMEVPHDEIGQVHHHEYTHEPILLVHYHLSLVMKLGLPS
ncbi:unnamed protein product, partial [Ilex paraguariensis]